MKEDVRRIIEDLHFASRQPLFNGIVGGDGEGAKGSSPHEETAGSKLPVGVQSIDRSAFKRQRTENLMPTAKTRSWDTVRGSRLSIIGTFRSLNYRGPH